MILPYRRTGNTLSQEISDNQLCDYLYCMAERKQAMQLIHHVVVGLTLALKGFSKLQDNHIVTGLLLGLFGIFILGYFFYVLFKAKENKYLHLVIHALEAIACALLGYMYYQEGTNFLHLVFFAAAIGFAVSVVIGLKNSNNH